MTSPSLMSNLRGERETSISACVKVNTIEEKRERERETSNLVQTSKGYCLPSGCLEIRLSSLTKLAIGGVL